MKGISHYGVGMASAVAIVTAEKALRFLEHEASFCRSKDQHEALCLLLPALLQVLALERMNGYEAEQFRAQLKEALLCPAKH